MTIAPEGGGRAEKSRPKPSISLGTLPTTCTDPTESSRVIEAARPIGTLVVASPDEFDRGPLSLEQERRDPEVAVRLRSRGKEQRGVPVRPPFVRTAIEGGLPRRPRAVGQSVPRRGPGAGCHLS